MPGCEQLAAEEGTCLQIPGSGISGQVGGQHVAVGTKDWVAENLAAEEQRAASAQMEASTSQSEECMQVRRYVIFYVIRSFSITSTIGCSTEHRHCESTFCWLHENDPLGGLLSPFLQFIKGVY